MRLRSNERCPIHGGFYCVCHPTPKLNRRSGPVQRIDDPHHPRGYREICTPAELRRRTLVKVQKQGGRCAICNKPFRSMEEVTTEHILPKKMGGAERDDHRDNLQAACAACNSAKGSIRNYVPPDSKAAAANDQESEQ